jgi:hypothetical protein
VQEAFCLSLPWFPLSIAVALIALWLSDADLLNSRRQGLAIAENSAWGGLIMAFIGVLTAYISVTSTVELYAAKHMLEITSAVRHGILSVSAFVGAQIAIFAALLCFVVQLSEVYIGKTRRFAGYLLSVTSRHGPSFSIFLRKTGEALLLLPNDTEISSSTVQRRGKWVQFPEGTVVQWNGAGAATDLSNMGIISCAEGCLVYEQYSGTITGEARSVTHLDRRCLFEDLACQGLACAD